MTNMIMETPRVATLTPMVRLVRHKARPTHVPRAAVERLAHNNTMEDLLVLLSWDTWTALDRHEADMVLWCKSVSVAVTGMVLLLVLSFRLGNTSLLLLMESSLIKILTSLLLLKGLGQDIEIGEMDPQDRVELHLSITKLEHLMNSHI